MSHFASFINKNEIFCIELINRRLFIRLWKMSPFSRMEHQYRGFFLDFPTSLQVSCLESNSVSAKWMRAQKFGDAWELKWNTGDTELNVFSVPGKNSRATIRFMVREYANDANDVCQCCFPLLLLPCCVVQHHRHRVHRRLASKYCSHWPSPFSISSSFAGIK